MRGVRDRNVRWRTSTNPSQCVPYTSSLYIRISASRIGIYQGDPIVSVRFLIEERVRSTSYVVGIPDMHNEAIRLNTDKTARRSLSLRSAAKRRARKHSAVLHRNYPWALPCSYTPEETLQNSFAFWVEVNSTRSRTCNDTLFPPSHPRQAISHI